MDREVGTYVERERKRTGERQMLLHIIPERIVLRAFITVSRGHVRTSMMGECCSMSVYKRRRERVPLSTPKWGEHKAHQLLRDVFWPILYVEGKYLICLCVPYAFTIVIPIGNYDLDECRPSYRGISTVIWNVWIFLSVLPPFILRPKEAVKGIYLMTYQMLHNLYMLWKSWHANGQAGITNELQRTEPFWNYVHTLCRMYLKCFDKLQDWVPPHQQKEKRSYQCISANSFRGAAIRFTLPNSFKCLSVGTLKNPSVCRFRIDKADYLSHPCA